MEKINIHSYLKVSDKRESIVDNNYIGTKEKEKICYEEGNISVILSLLENTIIMNRKTEEYEIEMKFEKNKTLQGSYIVPKINIHMNLEVDTKHLHKSENKIEITYKLYLNNEDIGLFEFKLDYEVIK